MFDKDKRFISQEDAMEYYMAVSTGAYAEYSKQVRRISAAQGRDAVSLNVSNLIVDMPIALTDSICAHSTSGKYSQLKGHHKRDVVRNMAEAAVYGLCAEQLKATGTISLQIAYDNKGYPIGDAANITSTVVEEMKAYDNAYGQDGEVEVDTQKVQLTEMGKESLYVTSTSVKRMPNMSKTNQTPVQ